MVALNLDDADATLDSVRGTVRIGTDRARDGEHVDGALHLRGWEGVVLHSNK